MPKNKEKKDTPAVIEYTDGQRVVIPSEKELEDYRKELDNQFNQLWHGTGLGNLINQALEDNA